METSVPRLATGVIVIVHVGYDASGDLLVSFLKVQAVVAGWSNGMH